MEDELTISEEDHAAQSDEKQRGGVNLFAYAGAALWLFYLLTVVVPMYKNSQTIAVDGTVVSIISKTSSSRSSSGSYSSTSQYWHEFRFSDRQGVEHIAKSGGWFGLNSNHSVGSVVSIGYYPDDLSEVRDFSWFKIWKLQLILLFTGSLLFGLKILSVIQPAATDGTPTNIQPAYKSQQAGFGFLELLGRLTDLLLLGASYFIDYLRWTQLTPMVLVWGFFLPFVVLASLLNFQEESVDLGIQLSQLTAQIPGLNDKLLSLYTAMVGSLDIAEDGSFEFPVEQMKGVILKVWGYLSLVFLILGIAFRFIFRRHTDDEPATLRRKLSICAVAIAVLIAILIAISYFGQVTGDPTTAFVVYASILAAVSTYSLTVSHLLGRLSNRLSLGIVSRDEPGVAR